MQRNLLSQITFSNLELADIFKEILEDSKNIDQKGIQFHTKKIVRFRKGFT